MKFNHPLLHQFSSLELVFRRLLSSWAVIVISVSDWLGQTDGRKRFWSHVNNSKTVRDRPYVSMRKLIGTYGRALEWASLPTTPRPLLTPNSGGPISVPFKLIVREWRKCQWGTFENPFAGSEVMPWTIVQLLPKPQMSERRSSTICAAVKQPNHHCDDDLVLLKWNFQFSSFWGRASAPSLMPQLKFLGTNALASRQSN